MDLHRVIENLRRFREERDWGKHHNPKDLAIAISLETNELLEHFVWLRTDQVERYVQKNKNAVAEEIADVAIYLIQLVDLLDLDLCEIIVKKMAKNAQKYPVEKARDLAKKNTDDIET